MSDLNRSLSQDLNGAFPAVVELMGGRLYSGLRRLSGDHQEAEDLTQETLIRAHTALGQYPRERILELRLESWIWTIALNLGRNHLRDRSKRPTVAADLDRPSVDPDPVDTAAWDRRLGQLSKPQRTAVVLRHVAGLGIAEIAEATERPQGTIKADIHRGLEKLRTIMEEEK